MTIKIFIPIIRKPITPTGMVFNITLGFNQMENSQADDDRSRIYALLIGDTVMVNKV